jgi:PilZ domain
MERSSMDSAFADRRASPRYPAVENGLNVERSEGSRVSRFSARLLDVSRDGASFKAKCLPPCDGPIWLRLQEPVRTDWVTARVVWVDAAERVGVSLHQPCSSLFYGATLGIDFEKLFHGYGDNLGNSGSHDDVMVRRPPQRNDAAD